MLWFDITERALRSSEQKIYNSIILTSEYVNLLLILLKDVYKRQPLQRRTASNPVKDHIEFQREREQLVYVQALFPYGFGQGYQIV